MKKATLAVALLVSSALLFTGCETLENLCGFDAEDLGFTEDYNQHLNAAIYLYQQSDRCMRDPNLVVGGPAVNIDGASVTLTADSVIVDYGLGSVGADGRVRTGSIRIGYIGDYAVPGSTANIKLRNYSESDLPYTGEIQLANTTSSGATMPQYTITVPTFTLDSLILNGTLVADWLAGAATPSTADDDFNLSGNAKLTNTNTTNYFDGVISTPLMVASGCDYTFVSGVISITPSVAELPFVSIDFIDGDCANVFNATIDCEGNNLSFSYPIK